MAPFHARRLVFAGLLTTLVLAGCSSLPRPTPSVAPDLVGSISLEDGRCCIGAVAGEEVFIHVTVTASAAATQMRIGYGSHALDLDELSKFPWEPVSATKTLSYTAPINWSGFYVTVQFKDDAGHVSALTTDDLSVEGMPAEYPLSTP